MSVSPKRLLLKGTSPHRPQIPSLNAKDEILKSKQMLFQKHLGDQHQFNSHHSYNVTKDRSDDCISSNYPNSSRSTFRDLTCSSLSSARVGSGSTLFEYDVNSIAPSDSFEYENDADRIRIRQMESLWAQHSSQEQSKWRSPQVERKFLMQQRKMMEYMQQKERFSSKSDPSDSESDNLSESDHSFTFERTDISNESVKQPQKDRTEDDCSSSSTVRHKNFNQHLSPMIVPNARVSEESTDVVTTQRPSRRLFTNPFDRESSDTSTLQSHLSGYTNEYLTRARRFGAVVNALRKPGHHVGPAKNPDCQCEHCRRWVVEREQGRSRALSVGDRPLLRATPAWMMHKNDV